ncbi:MAG: hypothetical protein MJB57_17545 [Gemmatimonadetes bacterium]|nr:hypothetical protein [Gemmatimonadota bacterium]
MAIPRIASRERLGSRAARATLLLLLPSIALGAGCTDASTGLDEDTYVEVVARLTWSRIRFMDTPRDDSLRAAVLQEFGVGGQELLDFAERHGEDVEKMERIWEAVRLRIEVLDGAPIPESADSLRRLDSLDDGARER